jgi:hypothetical protein
LLPYVYIYKGCGSSCVQNQFFSQGPGGDDDAQQRNQILKSHLVVISCSLCTKVLTFENFCPALKDEIAAGATWNEKPSGMPGVGSQDFKGSWADLGFDDKMLEDALVGRIVACEWVRNHTEKWLHWLPVRCGPGTLANLAMTSCVACTAGYFCPGYNSTSQGDVLCPVGHFCPANSSEPQQCDRGRTSPRGASAEADCQCSASSVWISNRF